MATDDERREVAKRLRRLNAPSLIALMSILGVGGRDMCARLADLIEPDTASDTTKCDREALLALADEMDELCGPWHDCGEHYARRIREACGVVA